MEYTAKELEESFRADEAYVIHGVLVYVCLRRLKEATDPEERRGLKQPIFGLPGDCKLP